VDDIRVTMLDIQSNMEKDQYKNLSEVNVRLKDLEDKTELNNNMVRDTTSAYTKTTSDVFNEIQQIKKSLKALGEDPNFLSRY